MTDLSQGAQDLVRAGIDSHLKEGPNNATPHAWNQFVGKLYDLNRQIKSSPEFLTDALINTALLQVIRHMGKTVYDEFTTVTLTMNIADIRARVVRAPLDSLEINASFEPSLTSSPTRALTGTTNPRAQATSQKASSNNQTSKSLYANNPTSQPTSKKNQSGSMA